MANYKAGKVTIQTDVITSDFTSTSSDPEATALTLTLKLSGHSIICFNGMTSNSSLANAVIELDDDTSPIYDLANYMTPVGNWHLAAIIYPMVNDGSVILIKVGTDTGTVTLEASSAPRQSMLRILEFK